MFCITVCDLTGNLQAILLASLSWITNRTLGTVALLVALAFSAMGGSGFIPNPVDIAPRTSSRHIREIVSACLCSLT